MPFGENKKMLAVSSQGRTVIRDFASFGILKKGKGKSIIRLDKKDKIKFIELFVAEQELTHLVPVEIH